MKVCIVVERDSPADKWKLFGGWMGKLMILHPVELLHRGEVPECLFAPEEAETEALILVAKWPEFIGRLSIVNSDNVLL